MPPLRGLNRRLLSCMILRVLPGGQRPTVIQTPDFAPGENIKRMGKWEFGTVRGYLKKWSKLFPSKFAYLVIGRDDDRVSPYITPLQIFISTFFYPMRSLIALTPIPSLIIFIFFILCN
jgi:hypothetical protein